ncbi:stage II sporulation protein M [Sulfobacillus harzensis]|uniref:Stage II sporulation protein M n=1 Tax=Sulfobacillus harzensis TaxID=2729629 RepID=A0A7Y0L2E7_9FIRM|nr:stage II sporulation protein M [Sulfobacillus harzensis]NMP21135.1 stage II sporulation protein M [Sulfobacillus harzensis]
MITAPGNRIQQHFGRYTPQLYIALATLLVGILFGVLAVGTLSMADKLSLLGYLRRFLNLEAQAPTYHHIFRQALADNLKVLGLLYLLGVSVAGMPLVMVIVFFRGFVLGFASAFLVTAMQWQGAGVGLATIGLTNIFVLPALVIAASVALGFSWDLISPKRRQEGVELARGFAFFTGLVVVMAAVTLVGTALESYASPFLLHFLSNWGV